MINSYAKTVCVRARTTSYANLCHGLRHTPSVNSSHGLAPQELDQKSRASFRAAREGLHLGAGVGTREPVFFGIFVFWLTAVVCKQLSPGGEIYS